MSKPRKSSFSSDVSSSSKRVPNLSQPLRPLAPKPAAPTPQAVLRGNTTPPSSGTAASVRRSPAPCAVCYRIGCQLPTHSAFSSLSLSSNSNSPDKPSSSTAPRHDPVFESSYAYQLAQQYSDSDVTVTGTSPVYDLPLDAEMNTPEMHRLFDTWFMDPSQQTFRAPQPTEITGDLIYGPFFLPAMQDSLLCLSVLAASAAGHQRDLVRPAADVVTLTLLGQAIQQMRERINSDPEHVSDTTIAAAVFLWLANIFLEDITAMKSHSSSINAFVESRGGLPKLGLAGAVARFVRWVDVIHASIVSVPCRYLDTMVAGPQLRAPQSRYGLYWEQLKSNLTIPVDPDTIVLCKDACRLMEFLELADNEGISGAEYFGTFQRVCDLFAKASAPRAINPTLEHVNECIRLATALIQFHCFYGLDKLPLVAKTNLARLATAIKATGGPSYWQAHLDLLIWLLFVVVMIPINLEEKSWCLPFLCQVVVSKYGSEGKLKENWLKELRGCLRQFVWCDLRLEKLFMVTGLEIQKSLGEDDDEDDDGDEDDSIYEE